MKIQPRISSLLLIVCLFSLISVCKKSAAKDIAKELVLDSSEYPPGSQIYGEYPFSLFTEPDDANKAIEHIVHSAHVLRINRAVSKFKGLPGRWAQVNAETPDNRKVTGWIFTPILLSSAESLGALEPELQNILSKLIGTIEFRLEAFYSHEDIRIFTINSSPEKSNTCNNYGDSDCINVILKGARIAYTDFGSKSIGYFESFADDFALFQISFGEGYPCTGTSVKRVTGVNIKTLEQFRAERMSGYTCKNCKASPEEEMCVGNKVDTATEDTFFDRNGSKLPKNKIPAAILRDL